MNVKDPENFIGEDRQLDPPNAKFLPEVWGIIRWKEKDGGNR